MSASRTTLSLLHGIPLCTAFMVVGSALVSGTAKTMAPVDAQVTAAGADASWWSSVTADIARSEYLVTPNEQGLQAPNRAQNLRTYFRDGGIEILPRKGAEEGVPWRVTWRTTRCGRRDQLERVRAGAVESRVVGARVTYVHLDCTSFEEWYENKREGIEQGFTIHGRPAGEGDLVVAGQFGGGVRPELRSEEGAIDVLDEHGARVLRYGELQAWDAAGKQLPSRLEVEGIEVALVIEDWGAVYPITIDPLMTSPAWTAESDQAGAFLGGSVGTAGDVNGDGYSDVIVGAFVYDNGQTDEGRAFVYHGSAAGVATSPSWTAEGDQASAFFAYSVGTAGDVNGDGFSDVIVGALTYDNGQADEGRSFVYHGSAAGLASSPAWTAESNQVNAYFGVSVGTAGDVNGDGFSDVIVGDFVFDNGQTDEGRAFVYHGSATGLDLSPAWTGESDQAGAEFGFSVGTAGDVNGDGFSDVIVGALFYDNGQTDEGRAFVYHGSAAGLATSPAWTTESDQANAELGWSVAAAGDVNGDGFADVLIGAPTYDNGQTNEGRAFVYRGSGTGLSISPAWTAESNQGFAAFGISVGTAGDVNGDGFADVIVGADRYSNPDAAEGRAYVYFGSTTGVAPTPDWVAESDRANSAFGASVGTAGDVNGDGFSDVIVGANRFSNGQAEEGRAYVYHGAAEGVAISPAWTNESDQMNASFGFAVASAGDVNGDGYGDVVVGADNYDNGEVDEGRAFLYPGSPAGLAIGTAWTAEGNQAGAFFGISVGTAGDVNGDGYSDIIVGAHGYDNGEVDEGGAFVYHGSAMGLSPSPVWTAESDQAAAYLGFPAGTAGDVNGDGYSDIVVGASFYDNGEANEGLCYLYEGSAVGLATTPAWITEGDQENALFGTWVGTAGDVNGDGFSDVVVGASFYDNDQSDEGRAYVYLGAATGLDPSPTWTAESDQAGAHFGVRAETAGDVNGDGFSDIIVGAYAYDDGEVDEGRVFVYHGSATGLSPSPVWTAESNQPGAQLGISVGTAGDVNGDGFSDVIVGANRYQDGQSGEGRAYVYEGSSSGLSGAPAWTADGNQIAAAFGSAVGTAGDVNGDGFSDVIVGAYQYNNGQNNEGRAFVYYGNGGGGVDRVPSQARTDGSAPIQVLGHSDSPSAFRLEARGRTAAGRGRVRLQREVKPFGIPFDGFGLSTGPIFDTGTPVSGAGSAVALSELASGLSAETLYHWRLRIVTDSPFFPHSPWVSLAGNASSEVDLRTASAPVGVDASLPGLRPSWLEAGAPNPFAVATRLSYTLPERGPARLALYDTSGREVAVLVDEVQAPGWHAQTWDGRAARGGELPGGVYFARLEFGGRIEARKIVLAR